MIAITVDSLIFMALLMLGPLMMKARDDFRKYLFLLVNISLYALCITDVRGAISILVFVLLPYLYISLLNRRSSPLWPLFVIILAGFIFLKGYTWLVITFLDQKYIFSFKLLGLSYILFRIIDFLLHVKAGIIKKVSLIDYLNYIFSFWTILAGPIQRYRQFMETFYSEKPANNDRQVFTHLHRATNGLIKILIIGSLFKYVADWAYTNVEEGYFSLVNFALMFYSFPLFVYFNFSGYCDIVIAMAALAGFTIPENFNKPYLSRTMIEFWNRWHITLSQWLRDYVYQTLLKCLIERRFLNNVSAVQYISLFVTFFLVGIWHGTTINFVIFGALHALGIAISLFYRNNVINKKNKKLYENPKVILIERIVCMHYVCFTFLFFRV